MGSGGKNAETARFGRWAQLASCIAVAATLFLSTLGALHAAEHSGLNDSALCETCLAVTTEAIGDAAGPVLHAGHAFEISQSRGPKDEPVAQWALRLSARAPPSTSLI